MKARALVLHMKVINVHQRTVKAPASEVGKLLDRLSSLSDPFWPHEHWPKMTLRSELAVGATGGHGPIRYVVQDYTRGKRIKFRFTGPTGFRGWHSLEVEEVSERSARLKHTIEMDTKGVAVILWPLVFMPLHDALVEDALSKAQRSLGETPQRNNWSFRVKALRWLISRLARRRNST